MSTPTTKNSTTKNSTTRSLTKALRAAGYAETVRQGRGYVYLTDGDAFDWFSNSIGVCYVSDLTDEKIVIHRNLLANDRQNF